MLGIFTLVLFAVNTAERIKLWFRDEKSSAYTFLVYFDNVMYFIMFIPAVIVIEKYGIRISLAISMILSFVGSWIALMSGPIGVKIFGQLLIDAGFPFALNCVTKIPAHWFPY